MTKADRIRKLLVEQKFSDAEIARRAHSTETYVRAVRSRDSLNRLQTASVTARAVANRAASRERYRTFRDTGSRDKANAKWRRVYRRTLDDLIGGAQHA